MSGERLEKMDSQSEGEGGSLRLEDFNYDLPEELIAQRPAEPRDHSRLLVYNRATGRISDDYFYNLPDHLPAETTLVANNSRVEKCRLLFGEGRSEIFVAESIDDKRIRALVRPGKRFKKGSRFEPAPGLEAEVLEVDPDGTRTLRLNPLLDDPAWDKFRVTPFPPYIRQDESLAERYQTVFARQKGSKAAPTAGLHFTDQLIRTLKERGFGWTEVTLHVGLGTFAPVKTERIEEHRLHSEWYRLGEQATEELNAARSVTAVGTTSVRVLESSVTDGRRFNPCSGETDIFIRPGYSFRAVDHLITNFHLPESTLLMLLAAFTGYDEMKKVYRHAIREKYRFYSFGDGMLIL
ncbi:MAG: tRNA preQ1(34) S-adenosylmethionine ribosyltransferase-isomerase QueA [Balneolaceae bacterium]